MDHSSVSGEGGDVHEGKVSWRVVRGTGRGGRHELCSQTVLSEWAYVVYCNVRMSG
jgi:hypothetical protein